MLANLALSSSIPQGRQLDYPVPEDVGLDAFACLAQLALCHKLLLHVVTHESCSGISVMQPTANKHYPPADA